MWIVCDFIGGSSATQRNYADIMEKNPCWKQWENQVENITENPIVHVMLKVLLHKIVNVYAVTSPSLRVSKNDSMWANPHHFKLLCPIWMEFASFANGIASLKITGVIQRQTHEFCVKIALGFSIVIYASHTWISHDNIMWIQCILHLSCLLDMVNICVLHCVWKRW